MHMYMLSVLYTGCYSTYMCNSMLKVDLLFDVVQMPYTGTVKISHVVYGTKGSITLLVCKIADHMNADKLPWSSHQLYPSDSHFTSAYKKYYTNALSRKKI